jgi:hypothetical protein
LQIGAKSGDFAQQKIIWHGLQIRASIEVKRASIEVKRASIEVKSDGADL